MTRDPCTNMQLRRAVFFLLHFGLVLGTTVALMRSAPSQAGTQDAAAHRTLLEVDVLTYTCKKFYFVDLPKSFALAAELGAIVRQGSSEERKTRSKTIIRQIVVELDEQGKEQWCLNLREKFRQGTAAQRSLFGEP